MIDFYCNLHVQKVLYFGTRGVAKEDAHMETKKMSELARNNQTVMIGHIMEAVMITFTFFSEVAVGNRSIGYSLVVMILALAPVIAEIFFWKKR